MKEENRRYSHYKNFPKRIRQALFRLCIYGALLVAGEVSFYSITKIGREIPLLKYIFQYQWWVDPRLNLNNIWKVPILTFYGQASLYMFFVYGLICVVGLEPAYRWMKKKDFPLLLRGLFYMFIILGMECFLGWILFWMTGYKIWYYTGWGSFPVFTSFAIAPMWFICGLISENVINVFDSFDSLKMMLYGMAVSAGSKKKNGNKIAVISDVHIGRKSDGWFNGLYPAFLNIILYKIALDSRIKKLIILGDFFDTWLCPPELKPFKNASEVAESWKNALFMPALRKCIELCDEVWYIPGNHDMGITQEDLNTVSENGKTMILKEPQTYSAELLFNHHSETKYIRFEHGHASDLFNAPVSESDTDTLQGLPFGYYVTRLAAEESCDLEKILQKAYTKSSSVSFDTEKQEPGGVFIKLFVDALVAISNAHRADDDKLTDDSVIRMASPYTDVTVADVKKSYHSLLGKYEKFRKDPVNSDKPDEFHRYYLFSVSKKSLCQYAHEKFGKVSIKLWFKRIFSNLPFEKIVIMGHTHYAMKEYVTNTETTGIYANTGCICSCSKQKYPSWIEIINTDRGCRIKINRL
ncbi:MAG: metallophosphoesterase [Treponema sp.]|nr:metallophosphoesterase [Treponema sp.]